MRLALKLVLVFMLANAALAGIYGYLAVRREVDLFKKRADDEAEEICPVIEKLLAEPGGPQRIATSRNRSTGSSPPSKNRGGSAGCRSIPGPSRGFVRVSPPSG